MSISSKKSNNRSHEGSKLVERGAQALGHGAPCYYCGSPCNFFSGSPGKWPVALCHSDKPGVVKWHHSGCVTERLERLIELEEKLKHRGNKPRRNSSTSKR